MSRISERIGRSGEYFTASILAQVSDTVIIVPHSATADIIFEHDSKLYRCQVKTQSKISAHRKNWCFDMRKGQTSKNRTYEEDSLDLFAFVSLPHKNVVFVLPSDKTQETISDEHMKNNDVIKNIKDIIKSLN